MTKCVRVLCSLPQELLRWADITDSKFVMLVARRELRAKRPGLALKVVQKALGGDDQAGTGKEMWEFRAKIVKALGWAHLEPSLQAAAHAHFPPAQPTIF